MLHVPVALITEKLRGQSLDDEPLKVPREGTLQIEGKNVWMSCDGEGKDQEGNTTIRGEKGTAGVGTSLPFLPPLNDNERPGLATHRSSPQGAGSFSQTPTSGHPRIPVKPAVRFRSGNHNEPGPRTADYTMRAFETPPKKKHCRSLSVPSDSPSQGSVGAGPGGGVASTSPLVEGARVWRPIPITALTSGGGGAGLGTPPPDCGNVVVAPPPPTTHLPPSSSYLHHHHHHHQHHHHHHHYHHHHDPRVLSGFTAIVSTTTTTTTATTTTTTTSTAARLQRDFRGVGGGGVVGGVGGSFPMAPPSPLSVDSGRDTTTSSDSHTPPQSPVPRPSSATSIRSGGGPGSAFGSSFSASFSSPWTTSSPSGGRARGEVLQSRSLSCEEHMTPELQQASGGSTPCVLGGAGAPSPLSPCRGGRIPRCHSQPCVLHHRRCGKKRRRDDRPTLDFHKMTETAYAGKHTSSITPAQDIQKGRWRSDMDYMRVGGLMPIASSPRDTDLPATPRPTDHAALSTISDLDMAVSSPLPSTPPASDISSGIDIREPVKLIGEEEEEEEEEEELEDQEGESNCGCHRDLRRDDSAGLFPLTDLDLEQIENH